MNGANTVLQTAHAACPSWTRFTLKQCILTIHVGRDGSVCCTIQCYSYGAEDTRHYENFDYVNTKSHKVIKHFEPNRYARVHRT